MSAKEQLFIENLQITLAKVAGKCVTLEEENERLRIENKRLKESLRLSRSLNTQTQIEEGDQE
jgi:regulator of replication initiation timing